MRRTNVVSPCAWIVTVLFGAAAWAGNLDQALQTLRVVGPQGAGNAEAAKAWQEVSQADSAKLPAILASLDDANPLAANWIRSAVDAIAERCVRSGGKLPAGDLEAFVLDVRHKPRARRLAFEWLSKADPKAPERLIPKMLDDPSVEFRRDAVAQFVDEAAALATAGKKDAALAAYRQAIAAARDLDQVQSIAKKLEEFGEKVDMHAHFGFITRWKLIGPFDNTDEKGFDVAYAPEKQVDFAAVHPGKQETVKWIDHVGTDAYGKIDLNAALGKANAVVGYAAAEFMSPKERSVEFRLTSINAVKIWLNGELAAQHKIYHAGSTFDQYVARGVLKPGRNLILVKVCQNAMKEDWAQGWDFQFRVCDAVGTAVLSQDRVSRAPDKSSADAR